MSSDNLPPIEETWEQFRRICAHPLFSKSSNRQALLRELIQRLYSGSDEFAAKVLADELFGRDTSIAKVEGRTVRQKLAEYYSGDGRGDPIIISVPPRTFRPEIRKADSELSYGPRALAVVAGSHMKWPTQSRLRTALRYVTRALLDHPNHPDLLGIKALIHVVRAVYGEDACAEFEAAEHIVRDVYASHAVKSGSALAKASLFVSRYEWKQAELAFESAFSMLDGYHPTSSIPWHILFLAAQLQFERAIAILNDYRKDPDLHKPEIDAECAMLYILAGDLKEAERTLKQGVEDFHVHKWEYFFTPIWAVLYAAKGDFAQARETMMYASEQPVPSHCIIETAAPGLFGLFTGLSGNIKAAEEYFESHFGEVARLRGWVDDDPRYRISAFSRALAALGAGRTEKAVEWLNISLTEERDPLALWMHIFPFLEPLHSHSGFRALVTGKMKLKFKD